MHNSAASQNLGGNYHEEDKYYDNNSAIENDYIMSYLDNPELAQRRSLQVPNLFSQSSNELQLPFINFSDSQNPAEALQSIYSKFNLQDSWMMSGPPNTMPKLQSDPTSAAFTYPDDPNDDFSEDVKTKKLKTNKETEIKKTPETPSRTKNNIKNTYINKINSLITEPKDSSRNRKGKTDSAGKNSMKREFDPRNDDTMRSSTNEKMGLKKVRSCDVLKSDELEKLNVKLAKNRESARNSRIRKKVYIELLEKTVDQLQTELINTRKQLDACSNNTNKTSFEAKPITNLFSGKQQLFDRLEKMVTTKADESEVSFLIDSLRLRFGASGKDRVDAVNYMFKQIMEFLVPVHMKYLLWSAAKGKDLFNSADMHLNNAVSVQQFSAENTEYFNKVASILNLTENQRKHLLKYRKKLQGEKQKFESLISNMNQVRKSVLKQSNSLQIVIDEFRNYLTPTQTGQLLVVLEKERNRRELSADKLWSGIPTKKDQDEVSEESDTFLYGEDMADSSDDDDDDDMNNMNYNQDLSAESGTPSE